MTSVLQSILSACLLILVLPVSLARRERIGSRQQSLPRSICRANEALLEIQIQTDRFPDDTSWMLIRTNSGRAIDFGDNFPQATHLFTKNVCVTKGQEYTFALMDAHGDGICCSQGTGFYKAMLDGTVLFQGGQFSDIAEHTFTVPNGGGSNTPPRPPPPAPTNAPAPASSRIVHPHCDPKSAQYNPSSDDSNACSGKLAQCARDRSVHKWEYDEASLMLDQCFRSCANRVGLDKFCTLVKPPANQHPAMPYCNSEGQTSSWTSAMNQAENQFVTLLNQQRAKGFTCPGNQWYPPVAPVVRNPQLDCAARAQARKIVDYSISTGMSRTTPSLHVLCSHSKNNCDTFSERMEKSGYDEWWGYTGENASWGIVSPQASLEGWSQSAGHCPLLMKQDWAHIQVEVGIGFYEDAATGEVSWVMVAGQQ